MKIELHMHSSEGSRCGKITAEQSLTLAAEHGYDAVVLTDHFNRGNLEERFEGTPEERAELWLEGYRHAAEAGERLGVRVFFGLEARLPDCINDYLVFGATPEMVKENPLLHHLTLKELHELCGQYGALLVQAHPFREEAGCAPADPVLLDGIEVFNGNARHDSQNDKAWAFAAAHPHLIRTSGSDMHRVEDVDRGGIFTERDLRAPADLVNCLRDGAFERIVF